MKFITYTQHILQCINISHRFHRCCYFGVFFSLSSLAECTPLGNTFVVFIYRFMHIEHYHSLETKWIPNKWEKLKMKTTHRREARKKVSLSLLLSCSIFRFLALCAMSAMLWLQFLSQSVYLSSLSHSVFLSCARSIVRLALLPLLSHPFNIKMLFIRL